MAISLQWVVRGTPLGLEDNLMTNEQREKITALRHQGFGYTAIANSVGLSKDSVKAYCRSHGLAGEKAESHSLAEVPTQLCLNCGKTLIQFPRRKQKKFCCPECRTAWWNAHLEVVKQKAVYTQQFRVISIETVILAHRQRMQSAPAMASGVLTTSRECLAIRFIQGAWHGANDAQRKFPAKIMSIGL